MAQDENSTLVEKITKKHTSIFSKYSKKLANIIITGVSAQRFNSSNIIRRVNKELRELQKESAKYTGKAVTAVYKRNALEATIMLGLPESSAITAADKELLKALIQETRALFDEALSGSLRKTSNIINKAARERIEYKIAKDLTLGEGVKQIKKTVSEELSKGYITLTDRAGRNWSLERYAEMATRTQMIQVSNQATRARVLRNGNDLVQVSKNGSSHLECATWEGKVLSISGSTKGYPTVDDARSAGLFHPNCKHRLLPYVKELAED